MLYLNDLLIGPSGNVRRKYLHDRCRRYPGTRGLETMALTERHQKDAQICENNWVRRIVGMKRMEYIRMGEVRVEVGVKENIKEEEIGEEKVEMGRSCGKNGRRKSA